MSKPIKFDMKFKFGIILNLQILSYIKFNFIFICYYMDDINPTINLIKYNQILTQQN